MFRRQRSGGQAGASRFGDDPAGVDTFARVTRVGAPPLQAAPRRRARVTPMAMGSPAAAAAHLVQRERVNFTAPVLRASGVKVIGYGPRSQKEVLHGP